ncbi:MAG TPA: thermonuclease family protein [Actinomycetospora sp.]|uniref:thermonuclease family protein n=1 Tax=Actinomycetospora sp. TaxID=1872135 RepID=UPI002F40922D
MNPGAPARIVLGAACLVGLIAAVAVLTGAVRVGSGEPSGPAPSAAAMTAPPVVAPDPTGGTPATVLAVADPVTMDVRLEDGRALRVRALGIQPPEACYSGQALAFARRTLAGRAVTLAGDGHSDRFSRALAWVTLSQGDDYAVLAAEAGVVSSYAADAPAERMPAVRAASERARVAGRGLWGPPCIGGPAGTNAAVSGTPG